MKEYVLKSQISDTHLVADDRKETLHPTKPLSYFVFGPISPKHTKYLICMQVVAEFLKPSGYSNNKLISQQTSLRKH